MRELTKWLASPYFQNRNIGVISEPSSVPKVIGQTSL